jgi:hypothetical protein
VSEPTELHRRFLEVWPEYERMIAGSETLLAEGKGDPQACSRTLITMYRWLGGMSLALGKPDDVARDYFRRAATSAVRMMGLPGSTVGPRVVDVKVSVSANGKAHVDSERPRPAQVLSGKPSLIAYLDAMTFVVAFGSADDIAAMARYGPDDYQTEGLVVGRDVHRSAAGLRAWLRGQDDEARRELRSALRGKPTPGDAALWQWPKVTLFVLRGTWPLDLTHIDTDTETSRTIPTALSVFTRLAFAAWRQQSAFHPQKLHSSQSVSPTPFLIATWCHPRQVCGHGLRRSLEASR